MSVIMTDDSTNWDYVLKESKGCNLGEERNPLLYFYGFSHQLSPRYL